MDCDATVRLGTVVVDDNPQHRTRPLTPRSNAKITVGNDDDSLWCDVFVGHVSWHTLDASATATLGSALTVS